MTSNGHVRGKEASSTEYMDVDVNTGMDANKKSTSHGESNSVSMNIGGVTLTAANEINSQNSVSTKGYSKATEELLMAMRTLA